LGAERRPNPGTFQDRLLALALLLDVVESYPQHLDGIRPHRRQGLNVDADRTDQRRGDHDSVVGMGD